jgi:hypothetical protein
LVGAVEVLPRENFMWLPLNKHIRRNRLVVRRVSVAAEIAIVLTIEDEETAETFRDHTESAHVPIPERGGESCVLLRQNVPAEIA